MNIIPSHKVTDFLRLLDAVPRGKVLKTINLLEEFGERLRMPHSKYIRSNLFELRVRGKQEIRIFYCFGKNGAYLLHGFIKKSQNTPNREIVQALRSQLTLDI